MTKTDIFSGFLGAGKTTLIRKLISESYKGEKLVLIENEFGDIAIDGAFLKDAGIEITEMNSGCICCTLVGDFREALQKVVREFSPDRILIEPSGVGKLSDVAEAVSSVDGIEIGAKVTVVDAGKCRMYMRNFGEFFNDQVANADLLVLSRTGVADEAKVLTAVELLRGINPHCGMITTAWDNISGEQIRSAMEENGLKHAMEELKHEHEDHDHHHEHEDHDHEHEDHDHDHHEHEDHDHHHHHHHDHDHHHADEIFDSFGMETARKFTEEELSDILDALHDEEKYGIVLRAKGFVDGKDGSWIYFDYVPEEKNIRSGEPAVTGRFCVIGSALKEDALKELFNIG